MPGTKRKASSAAAGARPSKIAKSSKVARSIKAAKRSIHEKDGRSPAKASSKRIKPSLTKKESSVVVEDGAVTTVVPLKSGSSIGEILVATKRALKKVETLKKSSLKSPGATSGSSSGPAVAAPPLPPGGLLEVAISFDTTGSMYGVIEEVKAKVKDLAQRLQADIPGIRVAVIAHGDYCDSNKYVVKWIDFGSSLPELCDFVENVEDTYGGDGPECYELVLKKAREELAWTPGSQRALVVIGDDEPHPVGYTYRKQKYYIDWEEECELLKQTGVKVYGVQSGDDAGATKFFSKMAELTGGRHVNLTNFSSIFDFLMMICYREGNPDMLPVYASEIRARHAGGMAKDTEALVKKFGETSETSVKVVKPAKSKLSKTTTKGKLFAKKVSKPTKPKKTEKKTKPATKKVTKAAGKEKAKKARMKTPVKKIKGKAVERKLKKKASGKKKLLREKLNDAKFLAGPLNKLKWSKWVLAISDSRPKGYSNAVFKQSFKSGWQGTFHKQRLFDNDTSSSAVFEVGVRFPEEARRKIYVMYFKVAFGFSYRVRRIEALKIVKDVRSHDEMSRLVKNKLRIYIRRATGDKADIKKAAKYLHTFDYAWGWKRRSGHRKVEKNGIALSLR